MTYICLGDKDMPVMMSSVTDRPDRRTSRWCAPHPHHHHNHRRRAGVSQDEGHRVHGCLEEIEKGQFSTVNYCRYFDIGGIQVQCYYGNI